MLAIVKSAKDGKTSLELQLEPANLGKVQVSIQIDSQKQIQVAFTVEQQASRQALEQHMPQLRLALAQQGLDLGGFSMQMQQQHQEQKQSSTQHTSLNSELLADVDLEIMQENRMGVNIATDGRLSILA
ncbi:MAG TPA: flagellar hook-length control protein FliK [Mariprofundaceae bacterium]|nr:flagellar hook-length control protein FliK [Mariprofundaceae bacterium]